MAARMVLLLLFMLSAAWNSNARHVSSLRMEGEVSRDQVCTLCEEFAAQALEYLAANTTQTEIIELLHQRCSRVPSFEKQCTILVDYYAPLFFLELSSIQPENFCQKVNLCQQVALISTQLKEDRCQLCHRTVSEALEKLKDPDTQLDIIETLLKLCKYVEKSQVTKCKKVVFEYGPLILANAEQSLESKDLCTALHACNVPPFSMEKMSTEAVEGLSEA